MYADDVVGQCVGGRITWAFISVAPTIAMIVVATWMLNILCFERVFMVGRFGVSNMLVPRRLVSENISIMELVFRTWLEMKAVFKNFF